MKKIMTIVAAVMMTACLFAQSESNPEVERVRKILENKSWVFVADEANLNNNIRVDNLSAADNYLSCTGDRINVRIDMSTGNAQNIGTTARDVRRAAGAMRAGGNSIATLPSMYIATYTITSQEISVDKRGRHVTAEIRYEVEDSNVTNMNGTPILEVCVDVRDLSCTVIYRGFRSGETYYGNLMEKETVTF